MLLRGPRSIAVLTKGTTSVLLQCLNVRLVLNLHSGMIKAQRKLGIICIIFDP